MRPSFARCSLSKAILVVACGTLAACSAEDAQVGSGLPPDSDAGDSGSLLDRAAAGDAASESAEGGGARCNSAAPLRLYYRNLTGSSPSNNLNYIVKVENATAAAVPLAAIEVRYYFTNELSDPFTTEVFYTDTCCSNKITDFNDRIVTTLRTIAARPNATAYLGIGFAASLGTLAAGDAVQVEIGFHDPSYARNLDQANDYSYDATATATQSQWNDCPGPQCEARLTSCAITVHRDGALVWGTPP